MLRERQEPENDLSEPSDKSFLRDAIERVLAGIYPTDEELEDMLQDLERTP